MNHFVWFARDHDVLVLPEIPEESFLRYVTEHTGVDRRTLTVIVPPTPASSQSRMLSRDQLADPRLATEVLAALGGRPVEQVIPMWPDASVAVLAERLGALAALPGHAFIDQGGGAIVSSKAVFRAVAAGAGAPISPGAVCADAGAAEDAITRLIEQGHSVMVKLEYGAGGGGNEVLSPVEGTRPVGARRTVLLTDRGQVREYLAQHWDWLTDGGSHLLVVERYFNDSRAYYAEFHIEDQGIEFGGIGQLMHAPRYLAEVTPPELDAELQAELIEGGRKVCTPLHAMGYRGWLSADAVITPDRQVVFTEWNGRITSSTHAYHVLGEVVVGPGYAKDRVLLNNVWPRGWATPSFAAMRDAIAGAGLAYDPATRTGVLIVSGYNEARHGATYCTVAPDLDDAWEVNQRLGELFIPA
ncbi:peptide ligase PGM1-related protein [Kitasatospora sp. NBC_01266]|uniref:preATP grasp domain-containing protein n=1 Tax=Kitasatospora sp. NBC_01266 TaxID=2903572 RepID=UPI002E358AC2|nr:peptide ligase PGM1-related protein [Kitasatospora sp. NBC_01266]